MALKSVRSGRAIRALRGLVRLVYPPHCAACEAPLEGGEGPGERFLCPACADQIRPLGDPLCPRCGNPAPGYSHGQERDQDQERGSVQEVCAACARRAWYFDRARSFGLYEEGRPLAALIGRFKFRGDRALARPLAAYLAQASQALDRPDGITFVPLTRKRQRRRGFNQAELLARALGRRLELPVRPLLRKVRETPSQVSLSRAQRLVNVKGAFAARRSACAGLAHVWLVDDVYTTGATLEACAQALATAGVQRVEALTVARTPEPELGPGAEPEPKSKLETPHRPRWRWQWRR